MRDIAWQAEYLTLVHDEPKFLHETAHAIEHSPLERTITRDGASVKVLIYRGPEDAGWLLEIEDELGGSTVWDDPFDSDQAALDEALRSIEQEGVGAFVDVGRDQDSMRRLWNLVVAQPAIAELRRTLESANGMMGFHRTCGVFAAVASAPELRPPREWLDLIKGDHVFEDLADARRFTEGMMALYSEVLHSVTDCEAHCCPPAEDSVAVKEFCAGYAGIALSDSTWSQDARALATLAPIGVLAGTVPLEKLSELAHASIGDPERWLQRAHEELAGTVASLHAYWAQARRSAMQRVQQESLPQRRATPKVGRNERCPCGSGKKFKKCCAQ